jgi:hypothetical protein
MNEFIDINLYDSTDVNSNIITNDLHLFFQEIELAIKIAPGQIWGIKYSIDLNKYLFNQYVTLNQIKSEISNFIGENCEHAKIFQYDINVQILKVENKDLIYIELTIYSEEENKEFIQKFLLGE